LLKAAVKASLSHRPISSKPLTTLSSKNLD